MRGACADMTKATNEPENGAAASEAPEIRTRITARELRKQVFVLLFLTGFHDKTDRAEHAERYLEDLLYTKEVRDRIYERYMSVASKISQIDPMIGKSAQGWNLNRIGKVELAIMRVAVYEAYFDEEMPLQVAINEAVELARSYGGEQSSSFVNGVLAAVLRNNPNPKTVG